MHSRKLAALIIFADLVGFVASGWATPQSTSGTERGLPVFKPVSPPYSPPQTAGEQKGIHKKCLEAQERLEGNIAVMLPGRSWKWQLDAERSRKHLDELQLNIAAIRGCEDKFEASLTPEQESRLEAELKVVQQLEQSLKSDAQSLDLELRKKYPARWHVAQDLSHIQAEIRKWRKLHEHVATEVGANHQE